MTHTSTEQERAEFEARFKHLDLTQEPDSWGAPRYKHDAISLAWGAWQAARRAQVVLVPQGWKLVQIELLERIQESLGSYLSDHGWSQSDMDAADALDGFLAAVPQPPEAAPLVLPKPVGWFHRHPVECKNGEVFNYQIASADRKDGWEESPLYTEQQVRALLDARCEWEGIHTMPTCDDLIWLYCQDTNTIDGPIAPEPSLEQYGWTHWAYANAPSTAMLSAAPKPPELKSNSPEFDGIKSALTDEVIDEIAESMPDGIQGFMKIWGWRQFARAIEAALAAQAKQGERP